MFSRDLSNLPAADQLYAWVREPAPTAEDKTDIVQPSVSIIVPTRNEAGNIQELVQRIERALAEMPKEIIFVDDSDDGTPDAIVQASRSVAGAGVILVHRPPRQRHGGLSRAVVNGVSRAQAPYVCVMDADLQHPPELVPQLVEHAFTSRADIVVASRFCEGSSTRDFGLFRTFVSRTLIAAARLMFPAQLERVRDPLTGFFVIRRDAVSPQKLRPRGFKILLELLIRSPDLHVEEVPFEFGTRHAGESKASAREAVQYFAHLFDLRLDTMQVSRQVRSKAATMRRTLLPRRVEKWGGGAV